MLAPLDTWRRRTWRPTLRRARRFILVAGRRSKESPPGASAPPRSPAAPSRAPEADRAIGLALMRYVPDLLRWARRCGVPDADAPDVAQIAALAAWRAWESCDLPPEQRAPWLFTIVVHAAWRFQRRTAKMRLDLREPSEMEHAADTAPLPGEALEERESVVTLKELRAGTTAERWRVFVAYEIEGVSALAIAKRESAPLRTVYTRLRLARRDVRAVVQRHRARLAHAEQAAQRKRAKGND